MIYTVIFQNNKGILSKGRYTGSPDRKQAWRHAAKMGESDEVCLMAMVPGDHPVYTYQEMTASMPNDELKNHNVFDMPAVLHSNDTFEMT